MEMERIQKFHFCSPISNNKKNCIFQETQQDETKQVLIFPSKSPAFQDLTLTHHRIHRSQ